MNLIDIPQFINIHITNRPTSLFAPDMESNSAILSKKIEGKSVLVIGGAGTIGSSYIKAILKFKPGKLYVVDTNENGLTELTRTLRSDVNMYVPEDYKTYPMSFGDPVFRKMFLAEGPFHIVANFAAHKHVRSEKDKYSIEAMIENNVFKAKEFLDLLTENKPEHFFCVSTDKAANPVNVMGASKKLMEEVIMSYSNELQITTARFANVAFSNGSLLAGYIERLLQNQPISCPADVKRFFVSPEESGQICMLACMLGNSGEIFFPKLAEEEMVFFKDITIDFFKASNRPILECKSDQEAKEKALSTKDGDPYPVYFFDTDTSGEKLYEEFYTDTDVVDQETYDSLGVIKNARKLPKEDISNTIIELQELMNSGNHDKSSIVELLKKHLPDFEHIETGKSLDQKM
ncbi:polysaccharide biosynthesis protein [Brumimicrobium aurantiacum]|uniref:NAD-dependent epimerase/dehydratase family protein n=1 Tax=Brumimicrobium aurantiacum TaxID=1737063 RepID=A0A3E1EYZ0_9FLAO|nr:polysaccharide biosynthesis protein [Brumimicrobium aurantiacum]RFC54780.1 NAD-dependent epimerase/dehydratase family protein [Brumimicrobium aurantiacum]